MRLKYRGCGDCASSSGCSECLYMMTAGIASVAAGLWERTCSFCPSRFYFLLDFFCEMLGQIRGGFEAA